MLITEFSEFICIYVTVKMQSDINCCSCESSDSPKGFQDLSPQLQNSLKKIIRSEDYILYNIEVKDLNTGGGNFLAELYEIDIKGETAKCEKENNIFVKQKIVLENLQFLSINEAYYKEEFMYSKLSKIFTFLQDQANVPMSERFRMPKSYDETDDNAIILENLVKNGFKTYDRMKSIPLKYAELSVIEMAKFHGLSFVIEEKMPEYFEKKIKTLEHAFNYDDDWRGLMKNSCTYIANLFEGEIKRKVEDSLSVILEKYPRLNRDQTSVKCALSHMDYRMNNVLVREEDSSPAEVAVVDYQLIDYGCPIRDFLYFIFTSTDQEFRRQHLNNLKDLYFETLTQYLKYFDIDVENIFPRQYFDKIYYEWLDYGFMVVVYTSVFLFAPESGLDLTVLKLSEIPTDFNEDVNKRLRGVVEDFVQWGYL